MDKLKKGRAPVRTRMTKLIGEAEALLLAPVPDKTNLNVKLDIIKAKRQDLMEWNEKVKSQMLDDDADADDMDKEHDEADAYEEQFLKIKLRIETICNSGIRLPSPPPSESNSFISAAGGERRAVNLPKIELEKFSGDIKEWLGFWSQFNKIHSDPEMEGCDKLHYLKQCMEPGTTPHQIVSSYSQTSQNYAVVVKVLESKYGNEDMLLQVYIRELLKLVISNANAKEKIPVESLVLQLGSHLRALETLKLEDADPATWLYPLVESSLPDELLLTWQRSPMSKRNCNDDDMPRSRLQLLMEFLTEEVSISERMKLAQAGFQSETLIKKKGKQKKEGDAPTLSGFHASDNNNNTCLFCGKGHPSQDCITAQRMSMEDKKKAISAKGACYICLRAGHRASKCRASVRCLICGKKHYGIMCYQNKSQENSLQQASGMSTESAPGSRSADCTQAKNVRFQFNGDSSADNDQKGILAKKQTSSWSIPQDFTNMSNLVCTTQIKLMTTMVDIVLEGKKKTVRAFIDPGSQSSYILDTTANEMGIQPTGQESATHSLLGGRKTKVIDHFNYDVQLQRCGGGFTGLMEMRGLDKICNAIPRVPRDPELFLQLKGNGIFVNDVECNSTTPEIEILIGGDYFGQLFTGKQVELENGVTATETKLGWVLSGGKKMKTRDAVTMMVMTMTAFDAPIEEMWKLENLGIHDDADCKTAAEVEKEAKDNFMKTISRTVEGRYCVKLPFLQDHPPLPTNKAVAVKRLQRTTKNLLDQGKFQLYDKLLLDWSGEFTEEVLIKSEDGGHYVPHRPVFKDSPTTPVRPVFDCSCKGGKGPSLNDCLQTGYNYVSLIPDLLLRFREKPVGVTADIRKAFQMIEVHEEDRKYLRFLWWKNLQEGTMMEYQHTRVVFGATCSPFILGAVLEHHLTRVPPHQKKVALKLLEGFYVDNYFASEDTAANYEQFREMATSILADAKMDLRMWMSNVDEFEDPKTITVPTLGIRWDRRNDILHVAVSDIQKPVVLMKRSLLSIIQKIFDPLGFVSPALIPMKRILQSQFISKRKWDDELPFDERRAFDLWFAELHSLEEIRIPRLATAGVTNKESWTLHTFTDASNYAYAAAVFLRVETDNGVSVQLLMSKARIAPVKRITIPRLELLGCFIGSRLAANVKKALSISEVPEYYWSDSSTALAWIKRDYNHNVFVRNRVNEIREKTRLEDWRHVPGKMNPADLPSRGCSPSELLRSSWWEGPSWLKLSPQYWPNVEEEEDEEAILAEVKKKEEVITTAFFLDGVSRNYTFAQQVRVMGWVKRFITNVMKRRKSTSSERLTSEELYQAELVVLKQIQDEGFNNHDCLKGLPVFLSDGGLIRMKTRIIYRTDLTDFKTPIVLPGKHPLVKKIIMEAHLQNCHGGVNFLMAHLREKYWVLQGRRAIKSVLNNCFRCRRYSAKPVVVEEAPLPEDRIKNAVPFEVTGVDLAGPLLLKNNQKAWIVLYTCAVYRAVYLDLVTSLSTTAFIKSMSKFVEVRGRPAVMYSDNGTNFVGATKKFDEMDWEEFLSKNGIHQILWKFNPPASPWWGGWWERLVRTVKDLLRKSLGKAVVKQAELKLLLKKVEEVVNSRPLTYVTEEPSDLEPLTPAMFLRTPSRMKFPEGESENSNLQIRKKFMETLEEELKQRFRSEYLALLISRPKRLTRPLQQGEIVFIGSDLRKRMDWQLGRILEFLPGADGGVRLARVKMQEKVMLIPVQRLYPLELARKFSEDMTKSGRLVKVPERLGIKF